MLDAKMKDKVTSVVLCAVLVFYVAFPVSGFVKPQKAEAIAPAIAAVSVFGTVLAAAGVYVAGTTASEYDANLGAVYDGFQQATSSYSSAWSQYVQDQGSFDAAMQSAVTSDGAIRLQTLYDAGLFDSVNSYTAYCIEQGTMVEGANSAAGNISIATLDGINVPTYSGYPPYYQWFVNRGTYASAVANGQSEVIGYALFDKGWGKYVQIWMAPPDTTIDLSVNAAGTNLSSVNEVTMMTVEDRGGRMMFDGLYSYKFNCPAVGYASSEIISYGISSDFSGLRLNGNEAVEGSAAGSAAAVVDTAAQSAVSTTAQNVVEPYYPTAEQLEAGFSSVDLVAANTGELVEVTGDIATDLGSVLTAITTTIGTTLNDIKTGVNGLESAIGTAVSGAANTVVTGVGQAVGALGDVVGDISTTLDNVWNGAQGWWADVLAWLGATPLAQLIAQIIAAVNAGVMTLEGAISAVQSWISSGVAEIVGAIEGIGELIPSGAAQEEPAEPQPGTGVALPPNGLLPSFELDLRSKAPFAYIVAFFETFQDAANTFSNNPSFYLDLKIPSVDENGLDPDGDELRFDAGEWLNYNVNGVTIAFIIRVLVTASICAGLIYVMYNAYLYAFRQ